MKNNFYFQIRAIDTKGVLSIHQSINEAKEEIIRLQGIQYQNKLKIIAYEIVDVRSGKVIYEFDENHFRRVYER